MKKSDFDRGIMPDDEYQENIEDYHDDLIIPEPGPLSVMPSVRYIRPAVILYIFFIVLSLFYWQSELRNLLWVSGERIITYHEYWRVLTSIGVHANAVHLLSNSLLFFVFGWFLHAYFGWRLFPAAALMSGLLSSAMTVIIYEPGVRLIGASGMVYSMVALWLVFYIRYDTGHRWTIRIMRSLGFALIMMFPTVYNPSTSYLAHAMGFIAGLITGLFLMGFIKPRENIISMKTISNR